MTSQDAPAGRTHWGFWATLLFGLGIAVAVFVVQTIALTLALKLAQPALAGHQLAEALAASGDDGFLLAIATIAGALVGTVLILGTIKLKRGARVHEYLALRDVTWRTVLKWIAALVAMLVAFDLTSLALGRPVVPEFMRTAYDSADPLWLFWLAVAVAAPVFEEVFFRGFLMKGFAASRLRPAGAVVLTAILWASIHTQYDAYGVTLIFLLGLLFGAARIVTQSLRVPLALHCLTNVGALVETALLR